MNEDGANKPFPVPTTATYPTINTYNIINSHNPTPLYISNPNSNSSQIPSSLDTNSTSIGTKKDADNFVATFCKIYQAYLDKSVPYTLARWICTGVFYILFTLRILLVQGWYIVTYALGIYLLNLFIAFLSPKIDPSGGRGAPNYYYDDEFYSSYYTDDTPVLPTKTDDEFKPFIRRLPEFKFWLSATYAVLISFVCTFFEAFDVPVFWPILVMYFLILFMLTMKRQIAHMIKYKYIPFTHGKKVYKGASGIS